MAGIQPDRFEPEHVPNPDDSESENKEVNDRLEGRFWCTSEGCKIMPMQRKCVCCREPPEVENQMEGIIFSVCCFQFGRSKWEKQFSLLIALDTKRQFNIVASSYILSQLFVFLFYFLAMRGRDFLYHCKRRIFDGLFKLSGARNCDSRRPLFLFLVFAPSSLHL